MLKQIIAGKKRISTLLMILSLILVLAFCISDVSAAPGDVIYVNASSGNDAWDGLSATWVSGTNGPKQSIKNATGIVNNGGTVNIADGIYTGASNTKIIINKNMNIIGQSRAGTIINGTNTNWIFKIQSGITVTIQNLTLTNGNTNDNGGAIYNRGDLRVSGINFLHNIADSSDYSSEYPITGFGGAIYNIGTLTADNSNFIGNAATYGGGAIHNKGQLTVTGSNFADNHVMQSNYGGGAISNNGILTMTGSSFTNNDAYGVGGSIYNDNGLNVADSTFTGNQAYGAGGAIYNIGNLAVTGSSFTNNHAYGVGDPRFIPIAGGAIYNDYGGTYIVLSSQFSGNIPQDIYNVTEPFSDDDWGIDGVNDPGINVKAASKTIPLQKTGLPFAGLIIAVLMVLGGLAIPKK